MKIRLEYVFEDEREYREFVDEQKDMAEKSSDYEHIYQWARGIWKHTDKDEVSVTELKKQFID